MSLEVQQSYSYDPRAADVWACGIVLFAMLANTLPFSDNDLCHDPMFYLWTTDRDRFWKKLVLNPSDLAKSLLEGLLETNASLRLSAHDALKHPFFSSE